METTFILEYSKGQKAWHHNHGQSPQNTNGYVTISENCTSTTARLFTDFLESRYGKRYKGKLSPSDVQIEWALFTNSTKELF